MTEVWLVDLERAAAGLEALEQATPRLSAQDRVRAMAMRDPRDRRHRLAAYIALRVALERMAGPQVRGRPFVRDAGGKPALPGAGPRFSLSHIEGLALIAVTPRHEIGVDLEQRRVVRASERRRGEIIAAGRGLARARLPDVDAEATFLQAWARLEAVAKAQGAGLAGTLAALGLRGRSGKPASLPDVESAARQLVREMGLRVSDVELRPGLFGAVAAGRGAGTAQLEQFPNARAEIERLLEG